MKIAPGYILREIAGSWVVIPVGENLVQLNGIISLNESGVILWRALEQGSTKTDLVVLLIKSYLVDASEASEDIESFIALLNEKRLLL